jgi:hypothetical protein
MDSFQTTDVTRSPVPQNETSSLCTAKSVGYTPDREPMGKNRSADRCFRHGIRISILLMVYLLLMAGCAGGRATVTSSGAYPLPETALRVLHASTPTGTVTTTARIEITNHGQRYPLKVAVMMKRPAALRIESIPLLGPPDFFLSIDNAELRVFLPRKGTFYTGPAASWAISRFFPLALPASEIVSLLMGRPPEERATPSSFEGQQEDALYRIDEYRDGRKIRSLWIDLAGRALIRARTFTEGGETAYTADFAEYTTVGNDYMPQQLMITSGDAISLSLRYSDIRIIDDDAVSFALPIPEGIIPIPLKEK